MGKVWAVAANTIRQALRMKMAAIFIVLLLILLPIMAMTVTGDGTLKGRLQTFVSYGLSLTSLLLCLLTVVASTYTITSDIDERQIYTVATKPIRRHQILLGKVLGVATLDIALLVLFSGIIYAGTVLMPRIVHASDEELREINNEFYTARASLVPPKIDVSEEVEALYQKLAKEDQLDQLYPNYPRAEIIKQLTARKRLEKQAAAVGEGILWEFQNVRPLDPNQSLFIRFKYDVSVNPPGDQVYGDWRIGDLRQLRDGTELKTPIWRDTRVDPIRSFREIEVPAAAVAADGYLGIGYLNVPLNQTVVIFPLDDGLEVLYKADTYTSNFIKGVLLILCRLIFLACLGTLAASFLSFPVAILFCLAIFLIGTVSGFVLESIGSMSEGVTLIYAYTVKALVHLLPQFDKYNPTLFLVPARLMTWSLIGRVVLSMVCIKAFLLLGVALVLFGVRELARIIV